MDALVNTFQKYYKDGRNGTWDCRWFAGFLILNKSLSYSMFAATLTDMFFFLVVPLGIVGAAAVVIAEPYKDEYSAFNKTTANLFLWEAKFFCIHCQRGYCVQSSARTW